MRTRRAFLRGLGAAGAGALLAPRLLAATAPALATKAIPRTGERLPVIGMGSWITFDVAPFDTFRAPRVEVLRAFFAHGGAIVDSSPMYGHAEAVIGYALGKQRPHRGLFAATKVWTPVQWHGRRQIDDSFRLWGVDRFDLLQVHNMVAWESHLETLRDLKKQGRIRYIGITTSHGRRLDEMERVLRAEPAFDFVQLSYSLLDREAEARLLPLARERGIALIANRPFRTGALIELLSPHPVPPFAAEAGCTTWPQLLLKFVVSHPAVTCAIPATSRVDHMVENMAACREPLPDERWRARLVRHVESL